MVTEDLAQSRMWGMRQKKESQEFLALWLEQWLIGVFTEIGKKKSKSRFGEGR